MNLTENFTLDEFTFSQTAVRRGIDNSPNKTVLENLKTTAQGMEKIRALLNNPIRITSGFRSPALNIAIGGSLRSHHVLGLAADFVCPRFGTPKDICKAIMKSNIQYDQLIHEGTWVHISFAPTMRRQNLEAQFSNGRVKYFEL